MNTTTPVKPRKPSGPPRRPVLTSAEDASFWQRYRVIIIAVTLFIVIDLGVLVLNFYQNARKAPAFRLGMNSACSEAAHRFLN